MKTNKILSAIISVVTTTSVLSSYATAWTKPEYSFDYDALMSQYTDNCYHCYCSDTLIVENAYEPGGIRIFLKCEYSYFNSVWTEADFPEIACTGIEIDSIINADIAYANQTDEELQEHLMDSEFARHTRLSIFYEEDFKDMGVSEFKDAMLGGAIVDACLKGKHPEISAVIFDTDLYRALPVQSCDLNSDGIINAIDVTLLARNCVGSYKLDATQLALADVTSDGKVNAFDANMLIRYVTGKIDGFEIIEV